jgi:hypothetical protein
MSSKTFKTQASSSRVIVGGTIITPALRESTLSYLVPPPDIQWISDPNVVVSFKSLSKKDAITKAKALDDLRAFIDSPPAFQTNIEGAIVQAWEG